MHNITITQNDAGRRLDRFLRKYLRNASLSEIYKIIRKDIKINDKRRNESYMLSEGDVLSMYISDDILKKLMGNDKKDSYRPKAKKQFNIIFEDSNILIADKPFGLLTHGDQLEKKNHLANQVKDYLIEQGDYNPHTEKVFSPAPANRIDRNTTGLVMFGKNSTALKALNQMLREDKISKYYLAIVCGRLQKTLDLKDFLTKDERANRVTVRSDGGSKIHTIIKPLENLTYKGQSATLVEVKLVTGKSHQIRAHLSSVGHPIIGDFKYSDRKGSQLNRILKIDFGLATQLLHAYKLTINESVDELKYLEGKTFTADISPSFRQILSAMNSNYLTDL